MCCLLLQLPRIGDFNASESARLFFNLTLCVHLRPVIVPFVVDVYCC